MKRLQHLTSIERDKITILQSEGLSIRKGTVENINGLIRRFFPKGTNFDNISEEAIAYVEDWINNRPMKVLGFKTPYEKYLELVPIS